MNYDVVSYADVPSQGFDAVYCYLPAVREMAAGTAPWHMPVPDPTVGCYIDPPGGAWLWSPLLLLPEAWHTTAAVVLSVPLVLGALALAGLSRRDTAGMLAIAALSFPVLATANTANMLAWAALGLALAWRLRASARVGLLVAALCMVKPVVGLCALLWLVASRRWGALALAGLGLCGAVACWGVVWGPQSILGYVQVVHEWSVSLAPLSWNYRPEPAQAYALAGLAGLGAGAVARVRSAWAPSLPDASALFLACVAGILCSPVLWAGYALIPMTALAAMSRAVYAAPGQSPPWARRSLWVAWAAFTLIWLRCL